MKKTIHLSLLAAALLSLASQARATSVGLDPAPAGARSSADVGFALWDFFPATSGGANTILFDNFAPTIEPNTTVGASDGDLFLATLSANMNGMRTGSGARIYSGTGATDNAFHFTINANVGADLAGLALQIKFTSPASAAVADYFAIALTLNGIGVVPAPTKTITGPVSDGQSYNVAKYEWGNLNAHAGDVFSIAINSPADHVSLDGLSLDASVTPVPEPREYALAMGALLAVLLIARRRGASSVG